MTITSVFQPFQFGDLNSEIACRITEDLTLMRMFIEFIKRVEEMRYSARLVEHFIDIFTKSLIKSIIQ